MNKIEKEIDQMAKSMELLAKSRQVQKEEMRQLFTTLLMAGPEKLKKSLVSMNSTDRNLLLQIMAKAVGVGEDDWNGKADKQPSRQSADYLKEYAPSPIEKDFDSADEELMDYSQDTVKHQGDNSPKGFKGQIVADPLVDKQGRVKNLGEIKGKVSSGQAVAYEPEKVLNYENLIKPDEDEQLKDEQAQKDGKHRTVLNSKIPAVEANKKVRKEFQGEKKVPGLVKATVTQVQAPGKRGGKVVAYNAEGKPLYESQMQKPKSEERVDANSAEDQGAETARNKEMLEHLHHMTKCMPMQKCNCSEAMAKHAAPGVNKEKFDDCVDDVKKKEGKKVNAYAVCNASLKKDFTPEDAVKVKNNSENWEKQNHNLDKADISVYMKTPTTETMTSEDVEHETNKYKPFDQQKTEWKKELAKEPDFMKKHLENPEMPVKLDTEEQEHEDNKYLPWDEQKGHEDVDREYKELEDMYEDVRKANDMLAKKYLGFDKLVEKLKAKKSMPQDEKYMEKAAVKNPKALAAWIGRKKYGKEKYQHMAAEGKKSLTANDEKESKVEEPSEMEIQKALQVLSKKYIGFDKLVHKLEGEGKSEESAKDIAASIGRKKYGKEAFQHAAATGHKMGKSETNDDKEDVELAEDVESLVNQHNKANAPAEAHEAKQKEEKMKDMEKSKEDTIGHYPHKVFDKEKEAAVLKSENARKYEPGVDESFEHKLDASNDPEERKKMWAEHWGYDWNLTPPIGHQPDGRPIYMSEHPSEEAWKSEDHEVAAQVLERMKSHLRDGQGQVQQGGMGSSPDVDAAISRHKAMLARKSELEKKLREELSQDLKEPKEDEVVMRNQIPLQKSVVWKDEIQPWLKSSYSTGRNVTYRVEDTIAAAALKGYEVNKSRWVDEAEKSTEQLQKSKKVDLNDIIEQKLDQDRDQLEKAFGLLNQKPIKGFNVKSFSDEDMIKSVSNDPKVQAQLLEAMQPKKK